MIQIFSEIGKLQKVMLHYPGLEIESINPDLMEQQLFEDTPFLEVAQQEHDYFADILKSHNVEVVYLHDLLEQTIMLGSDIKQNLVDTYLQCYDFIHNKSYQPLSELLLSLSPKELAFKLLTGIRKQELKHLTSKYSLTHFFRQNNTQDSSFYVEPLINSIFVRDPSFSIGSHICFAKMHHKARDKEALLTSFIFNNNPTLKSPKIDQLRENEYALEGGDVLVLNQDTILIGCSQRTTSQGIDILANQLFTHTNYENIYVMQIVTKRAYMHLDTVLTQVSNNKFVIASTAFNKASMYYLKKSHSTKKIYTVSHIKDSFQTTLSKILNTDVSFIKCGGDDHLRANLEQWNDGANTLAIAPGEVIAYNRNKTTNQLLIDSGIIVHQCPSSELSRGRGGPRCMSMPLVRECLS